MMLGGRNIRNSRQVSNMECKHKRIKKNYPFGHNSSPKMYCKDCGKVISLKEISDRNKNKPKQFAKRGN